MSGINIPTTKFNNTKDLNLQSCYAVVTPNLTYLMLLCRQNWHANFIGPKCSEVIFFFQKEQYRQCKKMNQTLLSTSATPKSTQHTSQHDNLTAILVIQSHSINNISANILLSFLTTSSTGTHILNNTRQFTTQFPWLSL